MSNSTLDAEASLEATAPSGSHALDKPASLLTGPILPILLNFILPVVVVIAAQRFVAVLEVFWVSRLGAVAAAGGRAAYLANLGRNP